ncbi:hypothetical protein BDW74DRAFT_182854 [Aspergillus multicolor]|uniref:uncharacterized protein n=1 Tax=Aspergillus multicolor TaxID=41759 RepID=UPI003CCCFF90
MASQNTTKNPDQPEEQSYYGSLKDGGYNNFQHFMHSHNLKMHSDDDIQMGKEILRCYQENDRAYAHDSVHTKNQSSENEKPTESNANPYDSDSDSDPPSGVRIGYPAPEDNDEDDSGEKGCRLDAPDNHCEWGLDEPEFEGYPVFSDDEEGFGQGGDYDGHDGHDADYYDNNDGGNGYENEDW